MAWVTPPTFVAGNVLTAAQLNILSGDLKETAPAKATAGSQLFVSTAANTIVPRTPAWAEVDTAETTTSINAYGDLATAGPTVTATTGVNAIVAFGCQITNGTGGGGGLAGYALTGATTIAAPASNVFRIMIPVAAEPFAASKVVYQTSLTSGSNVFTLKYTTPTGGTATFAFRDIVVIPL